MNFSNTDSHFGLDSNPLSFVPHVVLSPFDSTSGNLSLQTGIEALISREIVFVDAGIVTGLGGAVMELTLVTIPLRSLFPMIQP